MGSAVALGKGAFRIARSPLAVVFAPGAGRS